MPRIEIDIPVYIETSEILEVFERIRTVDHEYQSADNLHHKFAIWSNYPQDLYQVGQWIGELSILKNPSCNQSQVVIHDKSMTDEQVFSTYMASALAHLSQYGSIAAVHSAADCARVALEMHRRLFPACDVPMKIEYRKKSIEMFGPTEEQAAEFWAALKSFGLEEGDVTYLKEWLNAHRESGNEPAIKTISYIAFLESRS